MISPRTNYPRPTHEWTQARPISASEVVCTFCDVRMAMAAIAAAPPCTNLERIPISWLPAREQAPALAELGR